DSTEGTNAPCAAAAMYRHDAWLDVGGFDEAFVSYDEDMDLGLRLCLAGHRYRHVPESIVKHIGSAVTGRHSDYSVYHGQRNVVWTYVKNMPGIMFWKYLPQHLLFNLLTVAWFIVRGRGTSVLRAKRDALRGLPRVWRQRRLVQQKRRLPVHDFDAQLSHGIRQLLRGA
ncbi:MAG TPA: glycosyltransferase family 2 protein, partial [Planctomycetaceae bacterium]